MAKEIVKRKKQQQHVRRYDSGKATVVNRGVNKKDSTPVAPRRPTRLKPRVPAKPPVQVPPKTEAVKIRPRDPRSDVEKAAEFFGMKVGEPMSGYSYPIRRGFLIPYLAPLDTLTHHRWSFWTVSMADGKITGKIPQIQFDTPDPKATKMLKKCIDYASRYGLGGGQAVEKLIDWILWSFGDPIIESPPDIPEPVNKFWYQTFDLGILMDRPADYMAYIFEEYGHRGGPGWFATPINVCKLMSELTAGNAKPWESVNDPCIGTGSMLLPVSNRSLKLFGQDISLTMVKASHVNGWIYVPWLVKPFPQYMLDKLKREYENKRRKKNGKTKHNNTSNREKIQGLLG